MSERFHYQFETDLSELVGTSATNGTIAQSAGAALNGTGGGVVCTRSANSPNLFGYTDEAFTGLTVARMAWYTDLSSLTIGTNDDQTALVRVYQTPGQINFMVAVIRLSGVLNFRLTAYNDAGIPSWTSVVMGLPEWLELRMVRATTNVSADGSAQLYAGGGAYAALGEQIAERTGVDNYDKFVLTNRHLIGMHNALTVSTSVGGSLEFDEWTLRDDDTPILFGVSESTFPFLTYLRRRRRD